MDFYLKLILVRIKGGQIIEENAIAVDRWAEYFGELSCKNVNPKVNTTAGAQRMLTLTNVSDAEDDFETLPDIEEVIEAVERLKNNKYVPKRMIFALLQETGLRIKNLKTKSIFIGTSNVGVTQNFTVERHLLRRLNLLRT